MQANLLLKHSAAFWGAMRMSQSFSKSRTATNALTAMTPATQKPRAVELRIISAISV
jgi:hypothetical protein